MPWEKGKPRPAGAGRKKGTPNKFTRTFKEAVMIAFQERGGVKQMKVWAGKNETEFYRICARLIPTEISGPEGGALPVHITKTIDEVQR
jgi:hypothetical protein